MYGSTPEESAKVDMICEFFVSDVAKAWGAAWYEKDAKVKEQKVAVFLNETLPSQLPFVEKMLAALPKGSPYFLGNKCSLADIIAYDQMSKFLTHKPDVCNAAPLLHQLVTRVSTRPGIAAWYAAAAPPLPFRCVRCLRAREG
jgi:glutathione S-transferase